MALPKALVPRTPSPPAVPQRPMADTAEAEPASHPEEPQDAEPPVSGEGSDNHTAEDGGDTACKAIKRSNHFFLSQNFGYVGMEDDAATRPGNPRNLCGYHFYGDRSCSAETSPAMECSPSPPKNQQSPF